MRVATTKTGPRGGVRVSGRCACDDPALASVADVRKFAKALGECTYCGDRGLDLISFGMGGRYHVRCFLRCYDLGVLVRTGDADRVRVCCIGKRRMKELLRMLEAK